MNVRKRGLALLMCICMIFTLLPFSALADATTQDGDIVYGTYGTDGKWKGDNNLNDTATHPLSGENELTLTKTATKIADNIYRIDLKVVMTQTTSTTPPGSAATVLVIDTSGSMNICATCNSQSADLDGNYYHASNCATGNRGYVKAADTRLAAAKKAAISFLDKYKGNTEDASRYVSVVAFNTKANVTKDWLDVSVQANYTAVVNAINGLSADGGTNLDQALSKAKAQFSADTVKDISASAKNVIALTDGCPTYYEDGKEQHGSYGCYDTNNATAAKATELKKVAGVYTVCFGAANEKCWTKGSAHAWGGLLGIVETEWHQTDGPKVGDFLKDSIATSASHAYNASNTADLMSAFEAITNTIVNGLNSGTVTDPMGANVSVVGDVPSGFVTNDNGRTYTWELSGAQGVTNGDKTTYTYEKSYTVKLDTSGDDAYHPLNGRTTFTADGKIYDFNVPGVYCKALTYTVTYKPGDHGTLNDLAANVDVVHSDLKNGDPTPAAPKVKADDGYYFTGWEPERAATVTGNAEYTAQYAKKNEITVIANSDTKTYTGEKQSISGFKTLSFTIDGKTYTVSGLDARVSGTNAGEYTNAVTGTAVVTDADGNDVTYKFTVKTENGTFKIKPIEITLTSASDQKQYDGTPLTNSNVTVTKGAFVDGEGYTANVTGSQTLVGSSENTFTYTLNEGTKAQNYDITTEKGTLKVIDRTEKYEITVIAKSGEATYDGKEHSVSGFEKTEFTINGNTYTVSGLSASVKGIDAKEYPNAVTGTAVVKDANGNDVTGQFTVKTKDGSLTITKRPLTIIGESSDPSEITYDGQTHTYTSWSTAPATDDSGLVPGHQITGITYLLTGKDAGEYTGKFSGDAKIMSGEEDVTANYSIEYALGKMQIVPAEKIAVKIIGNHKEVWYNGQEQSVSGFTFEVADNTVTVELKAGHYAIAKGTNVKTYYMGLKSDDFTINHQNYKEVSVEIVDGYLTIKRHYTPNPPIMDEIIVEITGNSDSVVYDGTEHNVKGYTVKISDPRYTEKDFTFTGKAEASGVNAGTYEMGLKAEQFKNTNARFTNVKFVIKADGVLTITPKELTITAGSKTEYGPTPVTCDEWTVSGLVAGDKVESVKITGIQSVPGSSPNVPSDAVIKNAKGEDVTKNYAIKYVNGTLTMLEVLNKEDHFNYIIGTPEGLSLPTANVTRAEVATIFFRLMTDDARAKFDSLDNSFSDVAKGKWYNRAISTLAKAGIIKGDPAGTYRPGDPITRAEMAAIIARFGDFKEGGKTFSDISGHWAQKYIELAASNGWINGNPDGTFKPNNNITRAETVAMINRVLNRQTESNDDLLPVSQMTNWSDNMDTAKWYYRDMQEATNNHKAERVGTSMYEKWTEKLPDIDWASYQI